MQSTFHSSVSHRWSPIRPCSYRRFHAISEWYVECLVLELCQFSSVILTYPHRLRCRCCRKYLSWWGWYRWLSSLPELAKTDDKKLQSHSYRMQSEFRLLHKYKTNWLGLSAWCQYSGSSWWVVWLLKAPDHVWAQCHFPFPLSPLWSRHELSQQRSLYCISDLYIADRLPWYHAAKCINCGLYVSLFWVNFSRKSVTGKVFMVECSCGRH